MLLTTLFKCKTGLLDQRLCHCSDPYAIVKYNNIVKKSHWKIKNLNPRWLESFDFRVNDLTTVKVEVFDHDELSSDDFMGTCDISLDDLSRGTTKDMWVTLLGKNGDNTMHRGKVFIKLTLVGFAML